MTDPPSNGAQDSQASPGGPARPRPVQLLVGSCALGLLVLGIAWLLITGLVARARLNDVQAELRSLRASVASGDTNRATIIAARLRDSAGSAHALTSGPAWWVAGNIPVLGTPARTARVIAAQADVLGSRVLPSVVRLADDVTHSSRAKGNGIDLAPLAAVSPELRAADSTVTRSRNVIHAAPASWLGIVSSGRSEVLRQLGKVGAQLQGADRTVRLALPMLGRSGPRRYFIGFLNEAEARGLGGIPGAFAIAVVDHGQIRFEHFGSDNELHGVRADVRLGAQFDARYGQDDPTGVIQNSDISPDFRNAAQIWAGMWTKKTGERVDGAVAVDPTALAYLLRSQGDVTSSNPGAVTAASVIGLTQRKQYALYPGLSAQANRQRKAFLIGIAKSVAARLTHVTDLHAFGDAVSHAAATRRLVLWSARPGEERGLTAAGYAGVVAAGAGPFTGWTVVNAAGSKLDYYLNSSSRYTRSGCAAGSSVATLTLTNNAPRAGLPAYVTIRADKPRYRVHPGDNYVLVTYYGTPGARVRSMTLDGKPVRVAPGTENNLLAVTVGVELPATRTRTLRVQLSEPAVHGPVRVLRQPAVRPGDARTHVSACS